MKILKISLILIVLLALYGVYYLHVLVHPNLGEPKVFEMNILKDDYGQDIYVKVAKKSYYHIALRLYDSKHNQKNNLENLIINNDQKKTLNKPLLFDVRVTKLGDGNNNIIISENKRIAPKLYKGDGNPYIATIVLLNLEKGDYLINLTNINAVEEFAPYYVNAEFSEHYSGK